MRATRFNCYSAAYAFRALAVAAAVFLINGCEALAANNVFFRSLAGAFGEVGSCDGIGARARFSNPSALAMDRSGDLYVADSMNHSIRKVSPGSQVTTLAGGAADFGSDGMNESGAADGFGPAARFNYPAGVAVDDAGFVYISDAWNHTIRRISPSGMVTTLAGQAGNYGHRDGPAAEALFDDPCGIAVDPTGIIYVAERGANVIRRIGLDGSVSTLAGLPGAPGDAEGQGDTARFKRPSGLALDPTGNLWVADTGNHTIRMVTPQGLVKTVAGRSGVFGHLDGEANNALFFRPMGVVVDGKGTVFVADTYNNAIRKLNSAGLVETMSPPQLQGIVDAAFAPASQFLGPSGLVLDRNGGILVADAGNNVIQAGVEVTKVGLRVSLQGGLPVLQVLGGAGRSCTIESCSDSRPAAPWTPMFKLDLAADTVFVADPTAAGVPFRLYRVRP